MPTPQRVLVKRPGSEVREDVPEQLPPAALPRQEPDASVAAARARLRTAVLEECTQVLHHAI